MKCEFQTRVKKRCKAASIDDKVKKILKTEQPGTVNMEKTCNANEFNR